MCAPILDCGGARRICGSKDGAVRRRVKGPVGLRRSSCSDRSRVDSRDRCQASAFRRMDSGHLDGGAHFEGRREEQSRSPGSVPRLAGWVQWEADFFWSSVFDFSLAA